MIFNLLTGLREIRAPLTVGYLVLATAWQLSIYSRAAEPTEEFREDFPGLGSLAESVDQQVGPWLSRSLRI